MQFSTKIMLLSIIGLVGGAVFPFLMMARFIETTFWLSFLSYGMSVGGLLLGMYGIAMRLINEPKDEWEDWRGL